MVDEVGRIPSLLSPYRVLDLSDGSGFLCGKILADLGADVIKVEPPGGDPARWVEPFPTAQGINSEFRVQGSEFRVQGSEFRVQGSEF
jgi:crotonobetainyl-CoA:carnitine CoA-transferase CaiB-like acyl-CoA transferase